MFKGSRENRFPEKQIQGVKKNVKIVKGVKGTGETYLYIDTLPKKPK